VIIDKVTIYLRSGKGGQGCSTLARLSSRKAVASGGDGGKGGDVILRVSPHLYDLSKFKGSKKFIAPDGERGGARNQKGRDAEGLIVNVPSGTRVLAGKAAPLGVSEATPLGKDDKVITDLVGEGAEFLICKGGRGGKGNYKRDYLIPAEGSEEKEITLDYRIPNDVAILGFANSGKTSLFNALTGQERKVAEYAFTTTSCFWANSDREFERCVVLDTPPFKKSKDSSHLAENRFLRHIFRSKILLLLSDKTSVGDDFKSLEKEISVFDDSLVKTKKLFYLLSKIDTIDRKKAKKGFLTISINKPETIEALKEKISENLAEL